MSFFDSLMVSAFSIFLVFFVLAFLFVLVLVFSKVLSSFNKKDTVSAAVTEAAAVETEEQSPEAPGFSAGELKLNGVDEKTAAMIMAIVSHETRIPLSELCFKSIKALES
jgi:hypothetical protein